ncbi:hypothetical protein FOA52_007129 [Chlamydomonas sp. UWO 241]|nr:hypothetical protein FOA52_007129 [Chlamydomonas sp. UWO 241]
MADAEAVAVPMEEVKAEEAPAATEAAAPETVAAEAAPAVAEAAPAVAEAAAEADGLLAAVDAMEEADGEAEEGANGGEEADEVEEGEEGDKEEAKGTKRKAPQEPVTLGYKTFTSGSDCHAYYKNLMANAPMDTNMNEYEYKALLELLQKGHPDAPKKLGVGLQAFQVRKFDGKGNRAFYAVRKDGSLEDFSYLKCCCALFTDMGEPGDKKRAKTDGKGRGDGVRGRGRGAVGARGTGGAGRGSSPGGRGARGGRFGGRGRGGARGGARGRGRK